MIETVFRTIVSVNQLSIYGAGSDVCEEYGTCQTSTERPVVAEQSDPLFAPTSLLTKTPKPSIEIPAQAFYCRRSRREWESFHHQIDWAKFVQMQDSWKQVKSDNTSNQSTLTNSHNLQIQWPVVSTLCQEMKNHLTRKVGFELNTKIGPSVASHNQLPAK